MNASTSPFIPKKEIRPDFFFRFTSETDLSRLKASIRNSGIRTPLWVRPAARGGVALISGFRRFFAAVELGLEAVPAQTLPDGLPLGDWLYGVLLEHLSCAPLNLVEKARILRMVQALLQDGDRRAEHGLDAFTDLLEMPRSPESLKEATRVLDLPPEAAAYIETHDMPLRSARRFFRFSREIQGWLAKAGTALSIRPVELMDIGSALRDVSMREGRTIEEQVLIMRLDGLLNDAALNRNQKIEGLKNRLTGLRHPILVSFNDRLDELERNADLPPGVRLRRDRSLETPGLRLEADLANAEALRKLAEWLNDGEKRKAVEEMLKTGQCNPSTMETNTDAQSEKNNETPKNTEGR
jgi:hypothetical protein